MNDIMVFVAARYDEIEAAARTYAEFPYEEPTDAPWRRAQILVARGAATTYDAFAAVVTPDYVLADIAAKRQILAEHAPVEQRGPWHEDKQAYETEIVCPTCIFTGDDEDAGGNRFRYRERAEAPCETLCHLAAPFAGHPDYHEEWRPA